MTHTPIPKDQVFSTASGTQGCRHCAAPRGWAAAALLATALCFPSAALADVIIETWVPTSVGIGGQFGTRARAGEPGDVVSGAPVGFNSVPVSEDSFADELSGSEARATAIPDAFSLGVATSNRRTDMSIEASAAATTQYFISDPSIGFIDGLLEIEGDLFGGVGSGNFLDIFLRARSGTSFRGIEFTIFDLPARQIQLSDLEFDEEGNIIGGEKRGPTTSSWDGSTTILFRMPVEEQFGTIDLVMLGSSLEPDFEGQTNALDFLTTATLFAEPPEGVFFGLATGQAFVFEADDGAVEVPEPGSLGLYGLGLAAIAFLKRRSRPRLSRSLS